MLPGLRYAAAFSLAPVLRAGEVAPAENKKVILFFSALLGMIVNIYLNYILIPKYGAPGAAVATLISSSVVVLFLAMVFIKKIYKL